MQHIKQTILTLVALLALTTAEGTTVTVTWDKTNKTGTFTMPGGNVEVEPEYYPQAKLADSGEPTKIDNVEATTDDDIINAGTVAKAIDDVMVLDLQGTLMYYAAQSATGTPDTPTYDAEGWSEDVPKATNFNEGKVYIWYYIKGADGNTDEFIFSDGDICASPIEVTLAAAPTYIVEFADGIDDADKWTAQPNEDLKKGDQVTVTYTGTKKVLGVKAEKVTYAEGHALSSSVVGELVGSDGNAYAVVDKENLPKGVTAVAMVAYKSGSNGLAIALTDETGTMNWTTAKSTCEGKTAVGGNSWHLPSQDEWKQMFIANGGDEESSNGLNSAITTAGGTGITNWQNYWTSSLDGSYPIYLIIQSWVGYDNPDSEGGATGCRVRACLAF